MADSIVLSITDVDLVKSVIESIQNNLCLNLKPKLRIKFSNVITNLALSFPGTIRTKIYCNLEKNLFKKPIEYLDLQADHAGALFSKPFTLNRSNKEFLLKLQCRIYHTGEDVDLTALMKALTKNSHLKQLYLGHFNSMEEIDEMHGNRFHEKINTMFGENKTLDSISIPMEGLCGTSFSGLIVNKTLTRLHISTTHQSVVSKMAHVLSQNKTLLELKISHRESSHTHFCMMLPSIQWNINIYSLINRAHLECLSFSGVPIQNTEVMANAFREGSKLRILKLDNNGLSDVKDLATVLKINTLLKVLSITDNSLDAEGVNAIADMICHNKHLVELELLSRIEIPDESFGKLMTALHANPSMNHVSISKAQIMSSVMTFNQIINTIHIYDSAISFQAFSDCLEGLRENCTLTKLFLAYVDGDYDLITKKIIAFRKQNTSLNLDVFHHDEFANVLIEAACHGVFR